MRQPKTHTLVEKLSSVVSNADTSAVLSDERKYRYQLRRSWDSEKPTLAFIMLNPSTADEVEDDPTIRRCVGYAEDWGYGELVVGNLYAYRTSDPNELNKVENPVGPENDEHLEDISDEADKVVVAWGANEAVGDREVEVAEALNSELHALDTTKHGHPNHPLYQPKDVEPEIWEPRVSDE
ncbi:DUF1643 domain-containing protein [Halobacterium noricense]|uniref:DUF1643 domain-containing protein n=1 Tax=Halobacterium noricense TaxID=223182 RepID=UPI001E626DA8|nr:DUF1643 domain-containing protein [Halobacterium noricense]UHH27297.1 DUF1643 domain-containing protein [Halobacterium noricense]